MKKFLSLVLALVMTMSLVTISAGATEYKDFTDKDEIKYEEAVTVLNKLGIITGYSEGDFRPEGELTRGAAAKIIVSLLIGPDAATALGNETSPYPDVPAGNNFAGVISYCKTAKIISGYGDGTFRPQGTLTGYAFAKMLLGALGYNSKYEGFEGAGWNMNVARLGGEAGLFDRISFNGNATVTREQACQLALNTLKATIVEYKGGMDITTGDTSMVVKPERDYKVSANKEINKNIFGGAPMAGGGNEYYTLEFGEEHFVDLRLDAEATDRTSFDQFGRPSNEWSWKKVTIGTFPVDPDFIYTEQTEHSDATDAAKNRKTGLGSYHTTVGTGSNTQNSRLWLNGELIPTNDSRYTLGSDKVANISDYTDNGTVVEIYVSDDIANFITDVVVLQTQLMEVRRVGSDYVALQMYDNGNSDDYDKAVFSGFNNNAINERVENVQAEDDCYALLSGLKAGDIVAVIPVTDDGDTYEVADAYVPETVSGAITGVTDYGKTNTTRHTVGVTVGGTSYDVAVWNKELHDITADVIKATKKDVTLYLDRNGNAMLAKDVGATNDWMVVGAFRQALENGRIVHLVTGWDISGTAIELNIGASAPSSAIKPGDLVKYSSTTSNTAEWVIDGTANGSVYDIYNAGTYEIKASNTKVALETSDNLVTFDKSVKFIYVNFNEDDQEVESIEVKTVRQNVTNDELNATFQNRKGDWNPAQACVKDNAVKAVVVKSESNDAIASNMLYVRDYYGSAAYDSTNKMVYGYRVAMNTANGFDDDVVIYSYDRLVRGDFASYTAVENADHSEFYTLRRHNNFVNRTTGTYGAEFAEIIDENNGFVRVTSGSYTWVNGQETGSVKPTNVDDGDKHAGLVQVSTSQSSLGIGNETNVVDVKNANFLDLRTNAQKTATREIATYNDLKAVMMYNGVATRTMDVVMIVNDNPSNDGFRQVSMVVIQDDTLAASEDTIDSMKSLDSFTFKGVDWKITGTTINQAQASDGAAIVLTSDNIGGDSVEGNLNWTFTGKKAEVKIAGTEVTAGKVTLHNGDTIQVTVTDRKNATVVYTGTVTIGEQVAAPYVNTTAAGYADADGYVETAYTSTAAAVEAGTGVIKVVGNAVTVPVILTGDLNETKAQITEALEYLGYTDVAYGVPNAGTWNITATDPDGKGVALTYSESTAKAAITVAADPEAEPVSKLVAVGTKLNDAAINLTQNVSAKNGAQYTGTPGSDDVAAGDAYVVKAYTELDLATTSHHSVTGFEMSYYIGTDEVSEGDWVAINSDLTVRFTADGADVSNTADIVTKGKIAFASGEYTWATSKDTVLGTGTGATFTFAGEASGVIVPNGEYVSATVNVGDGAKYTLPVATYTASTT